MKTFPIGFWNYAPVLQLQRDCVKDWADAGMTLTMGPEFGPEPAEMQRMKDILDAASEKGIGVILCHSRAYAGCLAKDGEDRYRQDFAALLAAFGRHPAVFGVSIGDEPDRPAFPAYCRAMRIQMEMAPHLQCFCNLLPWHPGCEPRVGYEDWGAYLDAYVREARPPFLCYDCYSQLNPDPETNPEGLDMYFRNLREYGAAAARNGIPFWTTLLSAAHYHYRCPTEDDFRWQLNTALAHGAAGILYFFFYMRTPHGNYRVPPMDEHYERTETFERLSRVNRTFLKSTAGVMRELSLVRAQHFGKQYGGVSALDGVGRIVRAESAVPLVLSEFKHKNGSPYVMVVNNSQTKSFEAKVWMRGRRPVLHHVGWQGKEERLGPEQMGGWQGEDFIRIKHWLSPGQMELYRLEEPM